jgi:hypothetical protein
MADFKVPTAKDAGIQCDSDICEKAHPEGPYGAKGSENDHNRWPV